MEKPNCSSKSFKALMVTQFLGAFNDNAFKIVITLLALKTITGSEAGTNLITIIAAIFIIPFIIFSPYAGYCADKFSKRSVIVSMKIAEAIIMCMGFWALTLNNVLAFCVVLFFMAVQSAFFSPSKYGILPEILEDNDLSKGNGYLQMWTFLAIILGTAFGGQIIGIFGKSIYLVPGAFLFFSIVGIIASLFITKIPPANSGKKFEINFLKVGVDTLKEIKQDKTLFNILIAMTYFWFLGAVFQMNSLLYGKNILILSDINISILLVVVSVGIGAGSLFAGKCSEGKVELGLVPLGAVGMSVFSIILGIPPSDYYQVLICLFFLGVSGGIFIVPLNSYFQQKSPKDSRGKYLAATGITSSFAILSGSLFLWIMGVKLHLDAAQIFLVLGI
ncbi:MAG: MFS transporter, partial [Candidatus Omnitrophica bacterium]|nr:MFS transporter [Candidatus Omnitrophota bacterium]